jgi:hypothetical protein
MKKHISWEKIPNFKTALSEISYFNEADFNQGNAPVVKATGTTKLHGIFGGIVLHQGEIWFQSRSIILDTGKGNHGFYVWGMDNFENIKSMMQSIKNDLKDNEYLMLCGEWAGKGVQSKIGISSLPKSFYGFEVKLVREQKNQDGFNEIIELYLDKKFLPSDPSIGIRNVYEFPNWEVEVDFNDIDSTLEKLIELTIEVEKSCPVTKALNGTDSIGEGIVWKVEINGKRFS